MTGCRPGAVRDLTRVFADLQPSTVLLFTGGASFRESGAASEIEPLLATFDVESISHVAPNPTIEQVSDAVDRLRRREPDVLVAVGGGSVLDLAKATRGLADEADLRTAVVTGEVGAISGPPLVAIPTTAGSGSEVTHFAVVYVDGVKHSVGHQSFRPERVLLDPALTLSMPPRLTAQTGLDALAQAMESLWSTRSTDKSLRYARRALALALSNIEAAVGSPSLETRTAMLSAAHLAGHAIDISKTTAAHALSYSLTTRHGIAHGHAVALTLGALLEYNGAVTDADCADPRGRQFVLERVAEVLGILGAADPREGRLVLTSLLERIGLEATLSAVGITSRGERRAIVASVDPQRLANNPRTLDARALTGLVEAVA